jgi:uncharacterized protein (TIGR03067 family)
MPLSKLKIGMLLLPASLMGLGSALPNNQGAAWSQSAVEPADDAPKATQNEDVQLDDEKKNDVDAMQGKWSVVSVIVNGEEPPLEIVKELGVIFSEESMTTQPSLAIDAQDENEVKFNLDQNPDEMQFMLPPDSNPKAMLLTALEPGDKLRTRNAIYKLDGNTMTLCFSAPNAPSPVEFTGKKGSKQALWVLKRQPPKDDPKAETEPDSLATHPKQRAQAIWAR